MLEMSQLCPFLGQAFKIVKMKSVPLTPTFPLTWRAPNTNHRCSELLFGSGADEKLKDNDKRFGMRGVSFLLIRVFHNG
jgi:hypothetical protein